MEDKTNDHKIDTIEEDTESGSGVPLSPPPLEQGCQPCLSMCTVARAAVDGKGGGQECHCEIKELSLKIRNNYKLFVLYTSLPCQLQ